ncbi:unnamed protein product [Eruca vesicaria subsp. sativa]|uniref:Uncharacterized protein n=1 Tax=Eruca vesicaria subsp. sativa TaxID=29727 RepID=A0ABC8JBY3_ERUVS|nr:unnamed protein product [Eruca vesicaria subsp. sativa]
MANTRVLISEVKSGRCYSSVEARLLCFWEVRSGSRSGELTFLDMLMIDVNEDRRRILTWWRFGFYKSRNLESLSTHLR